ncbi:MAG TPA: hypothetical protein VEV81_10240, partial [Pyrinomonadaceae bacterium]|nr:hypothetical protein [Pyrinomonadaceae bacterium]
MAYGEMKNRASAPLEQRIEYHAHDWCSFGAAVGLGGGIGVALLGSILTALSWFTDTGTHLEKVLGTVLLVLTIPLLIIGAQCLDSLDKKKDKAREARFRENK